MLNHPVTFVGHPFTSIGKGEEMRSSFASFSVFDPDCQVYDVYRHAQRSDPDHLELCVGRETDTLPGGIRVFHINGDEVSRVMEVLALRGETFEDGINVAVPAWELPEYPADWTEALQAFDEVWAISHFVEDALKRAGLPTRYVGQAAQLAPKPYLSRRYFGIRPSSFTFLTFVDLSSFPDRKNPHAAIELYKRLRQRCPYEDIQLVVKAKHGDTEATAWVERFREEVDGQVVFVDRPLTNHETHSLIANCDCFVSLHRSEGFGRGPAEAMWLGRPAIATGWSGNMDYMDGYAGAVDYTLTPVEEGQYPRFEDQRWAEPDLDAAEHVAMRMLNDRDFARDLQSAGQWLVRQGFSFRAVGARMLAGAEELAAKQA